MFPNCRGFHNAEWDALWGYSSCRRKESFYPGWWWYKHNRYALSCSDVTKVNWKIQDFSGLNVERNLRWVVNRFFDGFMLCPSKWHKGKACHCEPPVLSFRATAGSEKSCISNLSTEGSEKSCITTKRAKGTRNPIFPSIFITFTKITFTNTKDIFFIENAA